MDKISKETRSWNMSRIKGKNTRLELIVRKYLHSKGIRYRLSGAPFGRPDIVIKTAKLAVFVHGCFWHQHGCKLSTIPKSNTEFWVNKLSRNVERDNLVQNTLEELGWTVITLWECHLEDKNNKDTTLYNLSENLRKALKVD